MHITQMTAFGNAVDELASSSASHLKRGVPSLLQCLIQSRFSHHYNITPQHLTSPPYVVLLLALI